MDNHDLSSAEARILVLEMSVAALIAQLPTKPLEEVVSLLCFAADLTEEAEAFVTGTGERQLGHVNHWAREMLQRVMASRKPSRSEAPVEVELPRG